MCVSSDYVLNNSINLIKNSRLKYYLRECRSVENKAVAFLNYRRNSNGLLMQSLFEPLKWNFKCHYFKPYSAHLFSIFFYLFI